MCQFDEKPATEPKLYHAKTTLKHLQGVLGQYHSVDLKEAYHCKKPQKKTKFLKIFCKEGPSCCPKTVINIKWLKGFGHIDDDISSRLHEFRSFTQCSNSKNTSEINALDRSIISTVGHRKLSNELKVMSDFWDLTTINSLIIARSVEKLSRKVECMYGVRQSSSKVRFLNTLQFVPTIAAKAAINSRKCSSRSWNCFVYGLDLSG